MLCRAHSGSLFISLRTTVVEANTKRDRTLPPIGIAIRDPFAAHQLLACSLSCVLRLAPGIGSVSGPSLRRSKSDLSQRSYIHPVSVRHTPLAHRLRLRRFLPETQASLAPSGAAFTGGFFFLCMRFEMADERSAAPGAPAYVQSNQPGSHE